MVRSHIQPSRWARIQPPVTTAVSLLAGARRWVPYFSAPALTHRPLSPLIPGTKNRWFDVVSMTEVRVPARILRSYRSVSWWTRTAAMVSGWVFPVLVLVARTFSPTLSWLIGTAAPDASSTLVPAVKLSPPTAGHDASSSFGPLLSGVGPGPAP